MNKKKAEFEVSFPSGRKSICYAIIARSGSGKTTQQIKMVRKAIAKGRRCLIIDPDGGEAAWDVFKRYQDIKQVPRNFKGAVVVPFCDDEYLGTPTFEHIENMSRSDRNGGNLGPWADLIIFIDDCNEVVKDGKVSKSMQWLFKRRRQHGFDIVLTSHTWRQIAPFMFGYVNCFLIGPTLETPHCRSSFFTKEGLERTEKVRQYLNDYKDVDPKNRYDGWLLLTIEGRKFKGDI